MTNVIARVGLCIPYVREYMSARINECVRVCVQEWECTSIYMPARVYVSVCSHERVCMGVCVSEFTRIHKLPDYIVHIYIAHHTYVY